MDLIVRNALLRGNTKTVDIGIKGETICCIKDKIDEKGTKEINAEGKLVTPTFIDPHVHLDKALISEVLPPNKSGTLREAIELIWNHKKHYEISDIVNRASTVIKWGILNGVTMFRTHVDVDPICGLVPLQGLVEVRKKFKDIVDIEIVAFPQEGVIQSEGTPELIREAMKAGADIVGGMPHNEMIPANSWKHIDVMFDIAKEFDADIDMHVDETDDPNSQTLQYLAYKTIQEKYQGRVTTGHTCALAAYNDYYAAKVIALVKEAQINMITNPVTNLMLEGRLDKQPIRRGLTRVKELIENGVNVCYGQDCLKDTFYPTFGKEDLLEVGNITAHAVQFSMPHEIETLFDMPTINSAKVLRLKDYGIKEGNPASFNIMDTQTVQEAFRLSPDRLYVIRKGKILAQSKTERNLLAL